MHIRVGWLMRLNLAHSHGLDKQAEEAPHRKEEEREVAHQKGRGGGKAGSPRDDREGETGERPRQDSQHE
jgi:hypothetical protein